MRDGSQPSIVTGQEGIQLLAYQMWKDAGCPEGQEQKFWFEAEARIRAAAKATPASTQSPASAAPATPKTTAPQNATGAPFNPVFGQPNRASKASQRSRRA